MDLINPACSAHNLCIRKYSDKANDIPMHRVMHDGNLPTNDECNTVRFSLRGRRDNIIYSNVRGELNPADATATTEEIQQLRRELANPDESLPDNPGYATRSANSGRPRMRQQYGSGGRHEIRNPSQELHLRGGRHEKRRQREQQQMQHEQIGRAHV